MESADNSGQARVDDRVIIADLRLRCIIGLNDWERETPQDVVVNVVMFTDVRRAGETDDPVSIINYRSVAKDIARYAESSSHFLVEALATAIARICVVDHGAARAIVRVEKPGAVTSARSVGVEIERTKADFGAAAPS